MKKSLKGFYLVVSSLFITLLHLPFAFAKTSSLTGFIPKPAVSPAAPVTDTLSLSFTSSFKSVYDSLHLDLSGLSKQAFQYAQTGWKKLVEQGKVINQSVIAIVDFSQPSSHRRLYVLDMKNYKVLFNTLVAHGKNSVKNGLLLFPTSHLRIRAVPVFILQAIHISVVMAIHYGCRALKEASMIKLQTGRSLCMELIM